MEEDTTKLAWLFVLFVQVYTHVTQEGTPLHVRYGPSLGKGNYSVLRKYNRTKLDIDKLMQYYTIKSRKAAKSKISIEWDYNDFGIQFNGHHASAFKLRRAPSATLGEPWPLPQHYVTSDQMVYRLNHKSFQIRTENYTCEILENTIKRYRENIFKFASEEYHDNLKYLKGGGLNSDVLNTSKIHEMASSVSRMSVAVRTPCSYYPRETSDESYSLMVKPFGVFLNAKEVWGALRGLETFSQLIYRRLNQYFIKDTIIQDFPRFQHRGILIDSSRHYIKKAVIFDVIEGMVQNKMNVLHWHLVDDQSFPYQSRTFPNLSDKGAYHPLLVYTPADIQEILEYARVRGVRVIPEFDTPGHTFSWGLGHPELLTQCFVNYNPVPGYFGPMDPSKNHTYYFLRKLFQEIYSVFPDRFIHLGGDEVPFDCWSSNPDVRQFALNLTDEGNNTIIRKDPMVKLWNYFVNRFTDDLINVSRDRGEEKRFIMWEEAMKHKLKLPKDTVINIWTGSIRETKQAIDRGHQVIYSTCWYLDWVDHGVHWPKYYRCDPNPIRIGQKTREKNILGGEACLWSEYITDENVISLLWPRASAVAERLWSSSRVTDVMAASGRLQEHRCRMLRRGLPVGHINGPDYCAPSPVLEKIHTADPLEDHAHARMFKSKPVVWVTCNNDLELASLMISMFGILMVLIMFGARLKAFLYKIC